MLCVVSGPEFSAFYIVAVIDERPSKLHWRGLKVELPYSVNAFFSDMVRETVGVSHSGETGRHALPGCLRYTVGDVLRAVLDSKAANYSLTMELTGENADQPYLFLVDGFFTQMHSEFEALTVGLHYPGLSSALQYLEKITRHFLLVVEIFFTDNLSGWKQPWRSRPARKLKNGRVKLRCIQRQTLHRRGA